MRKKGKVVLESSGLALTADSRVDQANGIIRSVKVLGGRSKNGRVYPPALLAACYGAYESAQVYADHDFGQLKTGKARPLSQWGGVLRGVSFRGGSLYGDLHCLKETTAGKIILEAAARCPDKFGLSPMHSITATKGLDGIETVTEIVEVLSVDAVTRPATTRTLFEQDDTMADDIPMDVPAVGPAAGAAMSVEDAFLALQNAIMADTELEDTERLSILKDVMKLKAKVLGGPEEEPTEGQAEETPAGESERRPIGRTARHLEDLARSVRMLTIRQMAGESLPLDGPTMAALLSLPDDNAVAVQLDNLRRQRRPRYSSGAPRSSGRVVSESNAQGAGRPAVVPRLTAGSDIEAVKRFWRG